MNLMLMKNLLVLLVGFTVPKMILKNSIVILVKNMILSRFITKEGDDLYIAPGSSSSRATRRRSTSREGSQQPARNSGDVSTAELASKLDDMIDLFKKFFN